MDWPELLSEDREKYGWSGVKVDVVAISGDCINHVIVLRLKAECLWVYGSPA